jgi:hypothetical protein
MSNDAGWSLQTAIYSTLTGSTAVQAFVGTRVYDEVSQGTAAGVTKPYIVIGESTQADWSTKTFDGQESTITLHAFSEYKGQKEVKQIGNAIYGALHNGTLSVSGQTLVLCQFEFSDSFMEGDGVTRHLVQRYRTLTQSD